MEHKSAPKFPELIEQRRIAELRSYNILDTQQESAFEDITKLAATICGTPMALVSFVDVQRQWFKSEIGLGIKQTPIESSICAHAILRDDVLVVRDATRDLRFAHNPLVTGDPKLRFYAGAAFRTSTGTPLGTVCVLDTVPRDITLEQTDALRLLAKMVMSQLELRKSVVAAAETRQL